MPQTTTQDKDSNQNFPIRSVENLTKVNRVNRQDVPDSLFERHSQYADFNQSEPYTQKLYIDNGHPDAIPYRRLRAFFEQLQWAANSTARFYSYNSENEHTEFWAPRLGVKNIPHRLTVRDREEYTTHVNENMNLTQSNTYSSMGSWYITTHNVDFFEAIRECAQSLGSSVNTAGSPTEYPKRKINWKRTDYFTCSFSPDSIDEFVQIKNVIDDYVNALVPARLPTASELERL